MFRLVNSSSNNSASISFCNRAIFCAGGGASETTVSTVNSPPHSRQSAAPSSFSRPQYAHRVIMPPAGSLKIHLGSSHTRTRGRGVVRFLCAEHFRRHAHAHALHLELAGLMGCEGLQLFGCQDGFGPLEHALVHLFLLFEQ